MTLGNEFSLVSVDTIGSDTGLASVLAKIEVKCSFDEISRYYVIKSFASLNVPSGNDDKVDMVLRELAFYRDLSPLVNPKFIKCPKLFGFIEQEGTDKFSSKVQTFERIILEYIKPPWRLGNQISGISFCEAKAALKSLAGLHSFPLTSLETKPKWLSLTFSSQENGFLYSMTPFLEFAMGKVLPHLFKEISEQEQKKIEKNIEDYLPGFNVKEVIETLEGFWKYWKDIFTVLESEIPPVLVHHDARADNIFFCDNEDGSCEALFVDWQNISLGPEVIDISYVLVGSLTIENRRKYEKELIKAYVDDYLRFNNLESSDTINFENIMMRYQIGCIWPIIWTVCTLSGIEELLDSCKKFEPVARNRAKEFMTVTAGRYLQAAIDHSSLEKLKTMIEKK